MGGPDTGSAGSDAGEKNLPQDAGQGARKKRKHQMLSSYTILLIITVAIGILTMVMARFTPAIKAVKVSDIISSPVKGVLDGIEISLFLLIFGGCMGIVNKVGAIETGIRALVRRLEGRELVLVPVIMAIFAVLGSAYGFCEETIPFYALLGSVMYLAGYDTMVSSATVLFGAGVGCLGSTVNPFANGVAIATLHDKGIECNQVVIIALGAILCVMAYCVSLFFILRYAKRIQRDKGSSILSLQEREACERDFGRNGGKGLLTKENSTLSRTQKVTLVLFALTFVVMICGFVPWKDFGINVFDAGASSHEQTQQLSGKQVESDWNGNDDMTGDYGEITSVSKGTSVKTTQTVEDSQSWTGWLTGASIGDWYFNEASTWFFVMAIVIALVAHLSEAEAVDAFIGGAGDMVGVALVVGLSRSIELLMNMSGLDQLILTSASHSLKGLSAAVFTPLCYLVYLGLSVIITSTSALASVSMPIMGPLAQVLHFSPDVVVMIFVAANGLANLFSPTAIFLPGLMLAHVGYGTYLRWSWKPIVVIGVLSVVILTVAMMIL
ncbi:MAG: YfcC family protein [Parafannyhessea sp.]|uniref:YfcC family protein n=1 Tax=Parafannyhessea sp. TaxID=2847324 RepID=UPI003F081D9E